MLLTKQEAADRLRLSIRTLETWIKDGAHAGPLFKRIGDGKWMILESDLNNWLEAQ